MQASVFYSAVTNLVQRVVPDPNHSQQQNVGETSAAGIEADLRTTPGRALEIAGSYRLLDRDNLGSPSTPLPETPRHKGLVSVTAGPFARVRGMVTVEFESGRETLNEGGHYYDVPSFAVVNAMVSWNVAGQLDIDVSGMNLSDRNYWAIDGYPEAGRVIRVAASWRF